MSQSQVQKGDPIAIKLFSVALFTETQRMPGFSRNMTGPAPTAQDAMAKMKGQTSADMPVVRVTDLSKTSGDRITVDMFNLIGGSPLMGDRNAEGRGEKLTRSTMEIGIDLTTKVVDAGGKMAQQRTIHQLREIGMAQLVSYFSRLDDQGTLVHMAGERGTQSGIDWVVPLASADEFSEVLVNEVRAPTWGRHYVLSGSDMLKGGQHLANLATTDLWTLDHIDAIRGILDEMEFPLQSVKLADDPAAADEPMWVLYLTPAQYSSILTQGSDKSIRSFHQNAFNRASYGSKHPLFRGEVGMWNGILVRKATRSIRMPGGYVTKIVTQQNRATAAETSQPVSAAMTNGFFAERAILVGAQALGNVYGKNKSSDYHFSWLERKYNFERHTEMAGDCMGGKAKLRFSYTDPDGTKVPTDHGVMVFDSAAKPRV